MRWTCLAEASRDRSRSRPTADSRQDLLFLIDDEHALLVRDFWQTIVSDDTEDDGEDAEPMSMTYCRLKG